MKVKPSARELWKQYFNQKELYPPALDFLRADWMQGEQPPEGPDDGLFLLVSPGPDVEPEVALFWPSAFLKRANLTTASAVNDLRLAWEGFWRELAFLAGTELRFSWLEAVQGSTRAALDRRLSSHRHFGWLSVKAGKIRLSFSRRLGRLLARGLAGRHRQWAELPGLFPVGRAFEDPVFNWLVPGSVITSDYSFHSLPTALSLPEASLSPHFSVPVWGWGQPGWPETWFGFCLASGREPGPGLRNILLDALQRHWADLPTPLKLDSHLVPRRPWAEPPVWLHFDVLASGIPCKLTVGFDPSAWLARFKAPALPATGPQGACDLPALRSWLAPHLPRFHPPAPLTIGHLLCGLDQPAFEDTLHELLDWTAGEGRRSLGRLAAWRESFQVDGQARTRLGRDPWFPDFRVRQHLPQKLQGTWQPVPAADKAAFEQRTSLAFEHLETELAADRWRPGPAAQADFAELWLRPRQELIQAEIRRLSRPELLAAALSLEPLAAERLFFDLTDGELALVLLDSEDRRWRRLVSHRREYRLLADRTWLRLRRDQGQLAPGEHLAALQTFSGLLATALGPEKAAALGLS